MLNITPTAVTLLNRAKIEKGAPDDFAVRFFATEAADSDRTRLGFRFVDSPKSDDTVVEEDGIKAYVAPEVERLIGETTRFLKSNFLRVKRTGPDSRFFPVKTPDDLDAGRDEIRAMYAAD